MKKKTLLIIILIIVVLLIGGTYAWLRITRTSNNVNKIVAGSLILSIDGENNAIDINPIIPISDTIGTELTPYTFNISNSGTLPAAYTIYIDNDETIEGSRIDESLIKYEIKKNSEERLIKNFTSSRKIIENVEIAPDETDSYELKLWIDESATTDINGQVFAGKLRIVGTQIQN